MGPLIVPADLPRPFALELFGHDGLAAIVDVGADLRLIDADTGLLEWDGGRDHFHRMNATAVVRVTEASVETWRFTLTHPDFVYMQVRELVDDDAGWLRMQPPLLPGERLAVAAAARWH